jgi:tripartite-type tricarboxylate transporter receptor subunit TctC
LTQYFYANPFMQFTARKLTATLLAGIATLAPLLAPQLAAANDFPNRPITLVVPYPPGGAADVVGRIFARGLEKQLKQPVVVDNKAGAGTAVGAGFVAQAKPDGYTLLTSSNTTFVLNPALKRQLPYDPLTSYESLGLTGSIALALIAHPSFPGNTLNDVISAAKAQPGKLAYASFGVGTSSHFTGELVKFTTGINLLHVPYKGSAPAMQDLVGGQVKLSVDTNIAAVPQLKAGKIKAIAIASPKRSSHMPDVPTFAELGYPAIQMEAWNTVVVSSGTPPSLPAKLTKALADAIKDPEIRAQLEKVGLDVLYEPPAAYAERVKRELPLMRALVHRAQIPVE